MKNNIKQEIQNKMLNEEQGQAVKMMIIKSMRDSYVNIGTLPDLGFENAAAKIAEDVLKDIQKCLIQSNVYKKKVETTIPLKVIKKKKNARK